MVVARSVSGLTDYIFLQVFDTVQLRRAWDSFHKFTLCIWNTFLLYVATLKERVEF